MHNTLTVYLSRYYSRKKGKIIFQNNETLNQLALRMSEGLSFGFDAAALSRIINGKRLFTPNQLRAFCHVLKIGKGDKLRLERALARAMLTRSGLSRNVYLKKSLYTKFLEYVLAQEPCIVKSTSGTSIRLSHPSGLLIDKVMEKLAKALSCKYPVLWRNQQEALLAICCMHNKNQKWYLVTHSR